MRLLISCCLRFTGGVLLAASIFKTENKYMAALGFSFCAHAVLPQGFFASLVSESQPKLPNATMAEILTVSLLFPNGGKMQQLKKRKQLKKQLKCFLLLLKLKIQSIQENYTDSLQWAGTNSRENLSSIPTFLIKSIALHCNQTGALGS